MKVRGFTLIEVLIASLILFIAISSATIVFNGAIKSKQNATSAITEYAYLPILMEHIGVQVRRGSSSDRPLVGRGHLFGADYNWQATIERQAPVKIGPNGERSANSAARVVLWRVALDIRQGAREQRYSFDVTGWVS